MSKPSATGPLFWGLLALSVAFVLCALIGAATVYRVKRAADTIDVTGSARRAIRSDVIVWRGSVSSQGPTPQAAYGDLRRHTERIRAYLAAEGVADSLIAFDPVQTMPIHEVLSNGMRTENVTGYQLTQAFEIQSREVDRFTTLARRADALIQEGVPLVSYPPQYIYTGLDALRVELLAEATENAAARARSVARSAGSRIGTVRRADTGVFQITPRYSTAISDYGINDTSSLEKEITAVVHVTFALD